MLLIHGDESRMNPAQVVDDTGMSPEYHAYNTALVKPGRHARRRAPSPHLRHHLSPRSRQEGRGPCRSRSETQEQLGGYYRSDVPDLDQAIDWAKRCPAAQFGTIEVRPIWPTRPQ